MTEGEMRVRRALIRLWAEGRGYTSYEIAKATEGILRKKAVSATTVRSYFARWETDGSAVLQESAQRFGKTAWRFRWGPESATLSDVISHAFAVMSPADRRKLATAMRQFLGLPARTSERRILDASLQWGADDLYGLPERVSNSALQSGVSRSTAYGYRSVTTRALQTAAQAGVVAVVLPRIWEDSPWEQALYSWFRAPHASNVDVATLRVYETYVRRCGEVATELLGRITPDELTAAQLEETIFPHIVGRLGVPTLPSNIRCALNYVARTHQAGPYAGRAQKPASGRGRDGYLYTKDGRAGSGDPEMFLQMLDEHGFDEDVGAFFGWYFEYSTLPEDEMWLRDDFPARPPKRHLTDGTLVKRLIAARAFAYQALEVAREKSTPLNLAHVLGTHGVHTAKRVEAWWRSRADGGEVASRSSWGLQDALKAIGMIARGAFDRHIFLNAGADAPVFEGERNDDVRKQLETVPGEAQAYWRLYDHCMNRLKALEKARKRGPAGHVTTDIKDVRRIYRETPPAYWARLQDALLSRLSSWKGPRSYEFHRQVTIVFLNGVLLSTGVRISEPGWIRLDAAGGYDASQRRFRLMTWQAWMRKNEKRHSAHLRERFCPAWLEDLYLNESRPWLIQRGIDSGKLRSSHEFLMVRPSDGASWSRGWQPNGEDEQRNCHSRIKVQVGAVRSGWQSLLAGMAAELEMAWPTERGEGAPHAATRNAMGYGLFLTKGEEAAAHYLGDSVESVRETYASTDGIHVDVSQLDLEVMGTLEAAETSSGGGDIVAHLRAENEQLKRRLADLEARSASVDSAA